MKPNIRVEFSYGGKIEAPFLQTGQEIEEYGFDRSALRDHNGFLILSGNQIKGNLRHLLLDMFGVSIKETPEGRDLIIKLGESEYSISGEAFTTLFGKEEKNTRPGNLKFFDARLLQYDSENECLKPISKIGYAETRSAQDKDTGATADGQLITSEVHFKAGEIIQFRGFGYCLVKCVEDAKDLIQVLDWVGQRISLLGADKTAGTGRVLEFYVNEPIETPLWKPNDIVMSRAYKLEVSSDHPLLISPAKRSGNVVESLDYIPGNVLFGAIWDWLELVDKATDFKEVLSKIRVLHAFPAGPNESNRPTPVSWTKTEFAEAPTGLELRRDALRTGKVSVDGLKKIPERVFRTRTAVSEGELTPENEELFTHSALSPIEIKWIGGLEWVGEGEAPGKFHELAKALFSGLPRIGKTAVPVNIALSVKDDSLIDDPGRVLLTLVSDAWLSKANGPVEMFAAYEKYFKENLGDGAQLDEFTALQSFKSTPSFEDKSWPLTLAGSEFALELDSSAIKNLNRLSKTGLPPIDPDVCFTECPFVPANGYGEFTIGTG